MKQLLKNWKFSRMSKTPTWKCWKNLKKSPIFLENPGDHVWIGCWSCLDDQRWATIQIRDLYCSKLCGFLETDPWSVFLHERDCFLSNLLPWCYVRTHTQFLRTLLWYHVIIKHRDRTGEENEEYNVLSRVSSLGERPPIYRNIHALIKALT